MVKLSFVTWKVYLPGFHFACRNVEHWKSEKHLWQCFVSFIWGEFRSEAEFITENDAQSNSSFPYDDIDEVTEAQPLTSQTTATGASGGNDIHEDQSPGKFWTSPFR